MKLSRVLDSLHLGLFMAAQSYSRSPSFRVAASLVLVALSGCSFTASGGRLDDDADGAGGHAEAADSSASTNSASAGAGGQGGFTMGAAGNVALTSTSTGSPAPTDYGALCGIGSPCRPGTKPCAGSGDGSGAGAQEECYLVASDEGAVGAVCAPPGAHKSGEPCETSTDCSAGEGCVETSTGGVCRPYCCGNPEECPEKTYCAPRPLNGGAEGRAPALVPVCTPAIECDVLGESYDCPEELPACSIVRTDGTTSCTEAGTGKLDESCPCADGFVCAKNSNTCKQLCHLDKAADQSECPEGSLCLPGDKGLPDGIGVCSGG